MIVIHRVMSVLQVLALSLVLPATIWAHDPDYTASFDRARCTFTDTGSNPYFPLWPGYALVLEGEEDDDGEPIEISATLSVLRATESVDGVVTRVVEERELEDGELVEVSRNFFAQCRETGDVWYFGEDVDNYEGGVIVDHDGSWRVGVDGAQPGIIMPGSLFLGARFFTEIAPGVAEDRSEIVGLGDEVTVPAGTFAGALEILDTDALEPGVAGDVKVYARGVGLVVDEVLELVEIVPPPCRPDATTHCLSDGRFRVRAAWRDSAGNTGMGTAILASGDSGEFWFFSDNNTELLVKVLDACNLGNFDSFWVFAAGLTNVQVTLTVTDTATGQVKEYFNPAGTDFQPILDTQAFQTCP